MGCYPIGKMVSKALRKCKGRKRRGKATTMVYSSPPTYSYAASTAKHVTCSHDSPAVVMMPSEPAISKHHSETVIPPSPQPEEQRRVRFAPGPDHPDEVPHHGPFPGRTPKESVQVRVDVGTHVHELVPPHGSGYRYMTSPSPRWEEGERRREYFGGEYNYYPTPIREGIYRIATDENRLTTIFSEENPNACSIV
ncbi:hypothetical protein OPV22_030919 [Ensete ventricosum]|uniref:Uncharacterized protein n=1 Tax=Ensete ventricosum TaxID=4639 RepID=A0AAV8PNF9_ENSVE|nr:hypothetical protein OPV22_030919 [Ensete ventricosum]RWW17123.1 hypothetical protein GW17_00018965 [Ensete ventricosum]RWW69113.1 hypothetical protein BHE74_00023320 [Ensete ventricosum]RZS26834.1 hypothetical protein BHM03_00060233 [Ensete ventricosum]